MGLGLVAVGATLAALVFTNWSYILSVTKNSRRRRRRWRCGREPARLQPRQFEELIAEFLASQGWQVELTGASEGGVGRNRRILGPAEVRRDCQLRATSARRRSSHAWTRGFERSEAGSSPHRLMK